MPSGSSRTRSKHSRALEEAKKLDPWNSDIKGYIYHCSDELDKAEREYLNMLDSTITAVSENLSSDLYEFHKQSPKRPVLDFNWKNKAPQKITQIIGQYKQT
jgi:hypothetical protein